MPMGPERGCAVAVALAVVAVRLVSHILSKNN